MSEQDYLQQLKDEKNSCVPANVHTSRLLAEDRLEGEADNGTHKLFSAEIDRVERGTKYTEVHTDKKMKLQEKVLIPIKQHPKFNFVGKLLGPQGNSLKRLQADTGTKMSILGKGSMRDKRKEDDMRKGEDPKYAHLNEDLHVLVEVFAPPGEAHSRMAHALGELKKYLIPVSDYNDEIRQQQLEELMYLNGDEATPAAPPAPPVPGLVARGRGRGRGAMPAVRGRGGGALLATPPGRGGPASRGMAPGRGASAPRGARGAPSGRGGPMSRPAPAPVATAYEEDYGYGAGYEDQSYGYGEQTYRDPYEQEYSTGPRPSTIIGGTGHTQRHSNGHNHSVGSDTQYFDYGHGAGAGREAGYEDYGESWGQNSTGYGKAPPARPKPEFRSHPYGSGAPRGGRY